MGIADLFHLQHAQEEWKCSDLSKPLPPVPGVHRIDRYRASFWKLLKDRSPIFEETARLYGMIPLQRLGKRAQVDRYHNLFHFIVKSISINWRMIRAIEYVFYHHPSAQVRVKCKFPDLIDNHLHIFAETGYDLIVMFYNFRMITRYAAVRGHIASKADVEAFINQLPALAKGPNWYSHESDILRFLILHMHGGIYFDIDVYALKPLDENFVNVLGYESTWGINAAAMIFEPLHILPKRAL